MTNLTFQVEGMTCAACVGRVEKALGALPFVSEPTVNLAAEKAAFSVHSAPDAASAAIALAKAGYPVVTDQVDLQFGALPDAAAAQSVERAICALHGVLSAQANIASERVTVQFAAGTIAPSQIAAAASATGHDVALVTGRSSDLEERKTKALRELGRQTLLALFLTLPIFAVEMGGHLIPSLHHWIHGLIGTARLHWAELILTAIILAVPGRRFFAKGIPQLLRGTPDMNALVAVGTLAAFSYSVLAVVWPDIFPQGAANVYFESAAVIVTLILFGRWMEARAKTRTGAAIRALTKLTPKTATIDRDGALLEIPSDEIMPSDVVLVRPGEAFAIDGEVISGESYVDEAMITGEPAPISKVPGSAVVAGTVNGEGVLRIRATHVGADTMLAQIIRLVDQAQGGKLPIQSLVDRVTAVFVPAVMAIAVVTVTAWLLLGPPPALPFALVAGVAVLIIACPCAMGLATPTSIMVGTGRAAELGVLFRQGTALQELAEVKVIAFDKTGTLTQGKPALSDFQVMGGGDENKILAMAAAAEAESEHPLAKAIVEAAQARGLTLPEAQNVRAIAGFGLKADIGGQQVLIGAERFMSREKVNVEHVLGAARAFAREGKTPMFIAVDGTVRAALACEDPIKPDASKAIKRLQTMGVHIAMLTGDTQATAGVIAERLGITDVRADLLPRAKIKMIEALKTDLGRTAFVGDGINDAPALAGADVGIAVGTGTDVAIGAADVVLVSGDIKSVQTALSVSRKTLRNIRQNLFWAFAYNVLLIPVAAGVFYPVSGVMLSPMLGAFAMAMSSVFVLTNALRLRFVGA